VMYAFDKGCTPPDCRLLRRTLLYYVFFKE
jgi:hypothetical protein